MNAIRRFPESVDVQDAGWMSFSFFSHKNATPNDCIYAILQSEEPLIISNSLRRHRESETVLRWCSQAALNLLSAWPDFINEKVREHGGDEEKEEEKKGVSPQEVFLESDIMEVVEFHQKRLVVSNSEPPEKNKILLNLFKILKSLSPASSSSSSKTSSS